MSQAAGIILALVLLGVYGFALSTIWRAPFRALGVLVAGMAVHNFLLMVLLRLGTPGIVIRVVQAWKEGILLLLLFLALRLGLQAYRRGRFPRLLPVDIVLAAFVLIAVVYFVLPGSLLGSTASLSQRILGFRVLLLLPLLYLFGRVFFSTRRADLVWNFGAIAGSAAFVGLVGFIELWFIPTRWWVDGGANLLSAWLGFHYHGPAGLPENFFQSAGQGLLLRRMVSTYVSPLPIAYTGLLIVPIATGLMLVRRNSQRWQAVSVTLLALVVIGMLLSITRLALFLLVAEFFLLALLWRRRWLLWSTVIVAMLVVAVLFGYSRIGPLVTLNLEPVQHRPSGLGILSQNDPSFNEHGATLAFDLQYVIQHPWGTGLGSSIHRFGQVQGTGESAFFDVFAEIGVLGGAAITLGYALTLVYALAAWRRSRDDPLLAALPLVSLVGGLALVPIVVTSDVWSDFSITFLLWWAAGFTVSLARAEPDEVRQSRLGPARASA